MRKSRGPNFTFVREHRDTQKQPVAVLADCDYGELCVSNTYTVVEHTACITYVKIFVVESYGTSISQVVLRYVVRSC